MVQTVPLQFGIPGGPELLLILLLAVLLFGADRLPGLARSSGEAIGEFRKGRQEVESEIEDMRRDGDGRAVTSGDGESVESGQSVESVESVESGQSGESGQRDGQADDETPGSTGEGESQDSSSEEARDEEVIRESDFQWGG